MTLEKDLESYVESVIDKYRVKKVEHKKIIRDAVLGSHELSPLEVSILDTPFVQRLRGISQTALTSFTYPSATHSRFEHSLGVSIMAEKMGRALGDAVDQKTLLELRIAGLLHDIGHGPFSHGSEELIQDLDDVKKSIEQDNRFSVCKPHEMIGYKILQTKSFKDFFYNILKIYDKTELDLNCISELIIGSISDKEHNQFKSDIINGSFDADKLDYLARDSYFTGIRMAVDTERIFATMMIESRTDKTKGIIVDVGGVHILEQIIFNKMLLYPSVYHHHKVRSALCMMRAVFEIIRDKKLTIDGMDFNKVSDFLKVDDHFFLTENSKPKEVADQIRKIKGRNLLKRALVLSRKTLEKGKEAGFEDLLKLRDRPQSLREMAATIADRKLNGKCSRYDLWIDLPENPRFPEPSQCIVKVTDTIFLPLDEFFPVAEWTYSFEVNKWRGYVFCPPELQKSVGIGTKQALQNLFGFTLSEEAEVLAKHASYAG